MNRSAKALERLMLNRVKEELVGHGGSLVSRQARAIVKVVAIELDLLWRDADVGYPFGGEFDDEVDE
jgi:hypothetical protein